MPVFLGIDVGTQGLKALLLDPERGPIASAHHPLHLATGLPTGHNEQDPAEWLDAVRATVARLRQTAPDAVNAIAAMAVSGQQHGLVALDEGDQVIRPAMLWNDVRSTVECAEIVETLGGRDAMFAATGLGSLPPGFTAGKLRWLFRREPTSFARTARVALPHDFVNLWLTGNFVAEAGDASGTGMFDVRARRYHDAACEAVAPNARKLLAPLVAPGDSIGCMRRSVAAELKLPPMTIVAPGGGDNMMAAIGAGAVEPGVAVMSLGTSGTIFAFAADPVCDRDGEIAPFCDSTGAWLPLGCTMNATVATETARALLGMDLDRFEESVRNARAGSGGVSCIPFFTGERSPDFPSATGSFSGLTPTNATPGNLARATMEGATFALARLLDRLRALGMPARELRLTGGGSRSPTWRAIVAASCRTTVKDGAHPDAAALGAAIQAMWIWRRAQGEPTLTLGACRRDLALDSALGSVEPDPEQVGIYAEARVRWSDGVDALAGTYPKVR